jgi:hypothetical protein
VQREGDRRVANLGDGIHAVDVKPLTRDGDADVRFILVVGDDDLDGFAQYSPAEFLDRDPGGEYGAGTKIIGICAGHVGQHFDSDRILAGPHGRRAGQHYY